MQGKHACVHVCACGKHNERSLGDYPSDNSFDNIRFTLDLFLAYLMKTGCKYFLLLGRSLPYCFRVCTFRYCYDMMQRKHPQTSMKLAVAVTSVGSMGTVHDAWPACRMHHITGCVQSADRAACMYMYGLIGICHIGIVTTVQQDPI